MFAAAWILIFPLVLLHQGSALLLDRNCNQNSSNSTQNPWMALIISGTKQCTGALINNQHVLTAAICVGNHSNTRVRLGDGAFTKPQLVSNMLEEIYVKTAIVHYLFNAKKRLNDIALLRLQRKVDYKPHIRPICLSLDDKKQVRAGKAIRYTSFLLGDENVAPRRVLIQRLHKNHCEDAFWFAPRNTQICGASQDRISSCNETGSPLVKKITKNGTSHLRIVGINSYGRSETCVYTNIISYVDWILHNILDVEILNQEI